MITATQYSSNDLLNDLLDFTLPPELEASAPPEARGLSRDEVRLMVSYRADNRVVHSRFRNLPEFLKAGDVVVINTSRTLNAAVLAKSANGVPFEIHFSTHVAANRWVVEVRTTNDKGTKPFLSAQAGETYSLPGNATVTLLVPYQRKGNLQSPSRLWLASVQTPVDVYEYLHQYGFPIRYSYVREQWPIDYYQTVYATEEGSAEMPSAGRAFTPELITRLVAQGVQIAPLVLHTGVASLESHEPPYEEYYKVPTETVDLINAAHAAGRRVIAVGTTVIRALETVTDNAGQVHVGEGWTSLVISPANPVRAVDGLLTGFHEPRATHLAMLEALASREHLQITYTQALEHKYLWHEFGDLHLILP